MLELDTDRTLELTNQTPKDDLQRGDNGVKFVFAKPLPHETSFAGTRTDTLGSSTLVGSSSSSTVLDQLPTRIDGVERVETAERLRALCNILKGNVDTDDDFPESSPTTNHPLTNQSTDICIQSAAPSAGASACADLFYTHPFTEVSSQLRHLMVHKCTGLRRSHNLADRIAFHYATRIHHLDQWQVPVLGIQGEYETRLFKPFICTWESCKGPQSFSSQQDWAKHISTAHKIYTKDKWVTAPSDDHTCQFCDGRFDLSEDLTGHICEHLLTIGQAVLDGSWRDIEVHQYHTRTGQVIPAELSTTECPVLPNRFLENSCNQKCLGNEITSNSVRTEDGSLGAKLLRPDDLFSRMYQSRFRSQALESIPQIGVASIQLSINILPKKLLQLVDKHNQFDSQDDIFEAHDAVEGDNNEEERRDSGSNLYIASLCSDDPEGGSSSTRSGAKDNDGWNEKDKRSRKRRKGKSPAMDIDNRPRLACPYQVYEPNALDCFKRGPRNPQGGCEDLNRLRCVHDFVRYLIQQ